AEDLKNEAAALENAAAADPVHADALRSQAEEKRKKAKQYAANAAALEISANRTRGPSLLALVDSGDLNLYDAQERKIYLKGKAGVAIDSLIPGAAIDATTPTETEVAPGEVDSGVTPWLETVQDGSAELVEMADQIVRETPGRPGPVRVLHEMLS